MMIVSGERVHSVLLCASLCRLSSLRLLSRDNSAPQKLRRTMAPLA